MELAYTNGLRDVLHRYPDGLDGEGWNYSLLSHNLYIPADYIRDHFNSNWDFKHLLCNSLLPSDLRFDIVKKIGASSTSMYLYGVKIILDLEILKYLLDHNGKLSLAISHNPTITLEGIQWLFESDYKHNVNWRSLQSCCSLEVLNWIINNYSEVVSYNHIVHNANIDINIFNHIVNNYPQLIGSLIKSDLMTDDMRLEILYRDVSPNLDNDSIDLLMKIAHSAKSPRVIESILDRYPNSIDNIICESYTNDIPLSELIIDKILRKGGEYVNISRLLLHPDMTDNMILKLARGEYPLAAKHVNPASGCKRDIINMELLIQLRDMGVDVSIAIYQADIMIELYQLHNNNVSFGINRNGVDNDYVDGSRIIRVFQLSTLYQVLSYLYNNNSIYYSWVECHFEVDSSLLDRLCQNGSVAKYINWTHLTSVVDPDLIAEYKSLPWNWLTIPTRNYLPSIRMMKTKAASKR